MFFYEAVMLILGIFWPWPWVCGLGLLALALTLLALLTSLP